MIWVEGEPGIGKTSLVEKALAGVGERGWEIGWGIADVLSERLPLRVMRDCLGVRPGAEDPRRARAAGALRDGRRGAFADLPTSGVEELLTLADKLCADAPLVMVIDDVQWADDASLIAFHQLAVATGQMPLLLVATCRPVPRRADVLELRTAVERRGAAMIELGPLPGNEADELVAAMLGAPLGQTLRELAVQAAGNPLYLRELVDALLREESVRVGEDRAEVTIAPGRLPRSLPAVLEDRLTAVSEETRKVLRTAALLGGAFSVTDLALMTRRPASDLAASVREAAAASLVVESRQKLAFRHPLIRQALYESMPEALRSALHAEGARELAEHGGDALTVAQQLLLARAPGENWTRSWLPSAAPVLITRAPRLAADLLLRETGGTVPAGPERDVLIASLARALLAAGSYDEAINRARPALAEITDPVQLAETYTVLARAQVSGGRNSDAIATLRQGLDRPGLPDSWRSRALGLLAMLERSGTGDLEAPDAMARRALDLGDESADAFGSAQALLGLWLLNGIRRDHVAALDCVDRAFQILGDDPAYADLRSHAYDNRVFTLQNLNRWPEAAQTLRQVVQADQREKNAARTVWSVAAVYWYWTGQWDDALTELEPAGHGDVPGLTYSYLREGWPALLAHGVAALIAGRRDQRTTAARQLREGQAYPGQRVSDRENRDFLTAARALALEQAGDARQAIQALAPFTRRERGEMTLTHQWLPDLVRLAVAEGDSATARTAARACAAEAEAETQPGRAAVASLRCEGLLRSDPGPLREAEARHRESGPAVELPAVLEDLAVVLAGRGQAGEARTLLNEAVGLYEGFGALWDIRRADGRLRPLGIRRGVRGRRSPRPTAGWDALTPTEVKVAALIGAGQSTSDIADGMFLSRRTVQKHVSNILAKLGARSRVEIVREALRQGVVA